MDKSTDTTNSIAALEQLPVEDLIEVTPVSLRPEKLSESPLAVGVRTGALSPPEGLHGSQFAGGAAECP
ncbi:MAG: hypothetical protein U1G07_26545 [Verrucomicrobiota bacterium]